MDRWWDTNNSGNFKCSENINGPTLDKNYSSGAPCGGMDGDTWVGDYSGTINFSSGNYVFRVEHDDGLKLWLNGSNIADRSSSGSDWVCPARSLSGNNNLRVLLREDGGDASVKVSWTTDTSVCTPPPGIPSLTSPIDGQTFNEGESINLSWSSTGDEYYGEVMGGPAGTTYFGWQTGTSKNIGSQWAGYVYSWHVKARNSYGESGWSTARTFFVRPGTPSNLSASAVSCSQINLTWSDNSGNEEGYKVYRNGSLIATLGSGATNYQDTGLAGSTNYSYTVNAYRGSIESISSNTASATTSACQIPPNVPTNFHVSNTTQNSITIAWDDVSNETGYNIYRWDNVGGVWEFYLYAQVGANVTSYTNTQLSCASDYFYQVSAYNANGESDRADWIMGTTTACPQMTLSVNKSGTGSGTVTSDPAGINCGSDCSESYAYNTSVTLTVSASAGSTFTGWSGSGCSGTGTCTVTMNAAKSVTANFNANTYVLSISKTGTGSGTVTSNPIGINCGSDCSESYAYNTIVTLTAAPTSPSTFGGWSGAGCSGTGTCTVTMDAAKSVTATFNVPDTQTLTVSKSGTGSGTVTSNPAGINCGSDCSESYAYNTSVTLTASASTGSTFTGWSGSGCSGTGSCVVSMTTARSVTASFMLTAFNKSSPTNGATGISTNPTLSWGTSSGATSYEYCYDTTNDNACSNWTSNGTATSKALSGMTAGTTYYWQVRAVGTGGTTYANGSPTAFWSFTTLSPFEVVLKVVPSVSTVHTGETFDVEIQILAGTSLVDGASAYLDFNPAYLKVIEIVNGSSLLIELEKNFDNTTGHINYSAGTLSNFPSGTFTVVTVTFQSKEETTGTEISFSNDSPRESDVTFGGASILISTESGMITISGSASIIGSVYLQGRPAKPDPSWSIPVEVSLTLQGESTPSYEFVTTTDQSGVFTVTGITPGEYTIRIKNSHTLQNAIVSSLVAGSNPLDFGVLREGDANNDNHVTLLDFSILASTFGKEIGDPGYDDRADFNEDDFITLLDFSLLATNFGLSGETSLTVTLEQLNPSIADENEVFISIQPPVSEVEVGEIFTITIQLDTGMEYVDGAQASIDFDPDKLNVISLTGNEDAFPYELMSEYDNASGTLDYASGCLSDFPSGTFSFVEIRFEALESTSGTPLSFHYGLPRNTDVTYGGISVLDTDMEGEVIIESIESKVYIPLVINNHVTTLGNDLGSSNEKGLLPLESEDTISPISSRLFRDENKVAIVMMIDEIISIFNHVFNSWVERLSPKTKAGCFGCEEEVFMISAVSSPSPVRYTSHEFR